MGVAGSAQYSLRDALVDQVCVLVGVRSLASLDEWCRGAREARDRDQWALHSDEELQRRAGLDDWLETVAILVETAEPRYVLQEIDWQNLVDVISGVTREIERRAKVQPWLA